MIKKKKRYKVGENKDFLKKICFKGSDREEKGRAVNSRIDASVGVGGRSLVD